MRRMLLSIIEIGLFVVTFGYGRVYAQNDASASITKLARDYIARLDTSSSLYHFAIRYSGRNPVKNAVYMNSTGILAVKRTIDGICLVTIPNDDESLPLAIEPTSRYADGTQIRQGYYEYTGLTQFTGPNVPPLQVHTFKEIDSSVGDEINRILKAKQKLQAEIAESVRLSREVQATKAKLDEEVEAEKIRAKNERLKLENEREISRLKVEQQKQFEELAAQKRQEQEELKPKLQEERKAFAASLLKPIDFELKHHYLVQRSIRKKILDIKVVDDCWNKLRELQKNEDWLGMLSCIDDEEYDEYPKENVVKEIVRSLLQKEFDVSFKAEMKDGRTGLGCATRNPKRDYSRFDTSTGGFEMSSDYKDRYIQTDITPEYGKNGIGDFTVKTQLLLGKLYFYVNQPGVREFDLEHYLLRKCSEHATPAILEQYEEWLEAN